ncbi:hypothetical protein BDW68DRAFT_43835 [Aspergillus falconensis]
MSSEVLRQDIPHCRTHLRAFILDIDEEGQMVKYEHALATSPLLSSIHCKIARHTDSYKEQAIMQIAAGAAPNLTQVYISMTLPDPVS